MRFIILFVALFFPSIYSQSVEDAFKILDEVRDETFKQTKITDEEEIKYGKQIALELKRSNRLVTNGKYKKIKSMGEEISKFRKRKNIPFNIHLIESKDINAFATAGGHVWITTEILNFVKSDDELAGIIGHEISHIDYLHCQKLIQVYVSVLKITGDDEFSSLANIVGQILNKPYSQQQESEADYYGVELAYKAGYDGKKMADFFRRLETKYNSDKERENLDKDLDRFFYTHPYNNKRYNDILVRAKELEKNGLVSSKNGDNLISNDDLFKFAVIGLLILGIGFSFYNFQKKNN